MNYQELQEHLAIALKIGWGALDLLRGFYELGNINNQGSKEDPVTLADITVNDYIVKSLKQVYGSEDFGYLSEETYKTGNDQKGNWGYVWVIDPLDGTREFIQGLTEFTIHIALVYDHRPVVSVVAYPAYDKLYYAIKGGGAFVETKGGDRKQLFVSRKDNLSDLVLVVSRSHRSDLLSKIITGLSCQEKSVGSVGGKIIAMVEQEADLYISLSGKSAPKDWDMAAPELILTEAYGTFTKVDLSPLIYNSGDVNQWGCLVASNGVIHEKICGLINKWLS